MKIPSFTVLHTDKNQKYHWINIIAGMSVAGLLLPEAIAYADIAGLSPQSGLIALIIGLTVYAVLGRSPIAIVSATSSSAAVLSSGVATLLIANYELKQEFTFSLILLTGVFLFLAGIFRLGQITHFISKPVLRGFSFGLALSITVKQIPAMVQIDTQHSDFFRQAYETIMQYSSWNYYALALGIFSFIILKMTHHFKFIPMALLLIIGGVILDLSGITALWHIHTVHHFQFGLPKPFIPHLSLNEWINLISLAFGIALIIYAESYTSIKTFSLKYGQPIYANRDLMALGIANFLSGLFKGMPVGAGYSATSANDAAGAKSKLSAWISVIFTLIFILFFRPYIPHIPEAILAAIVIYAVSGHIQLAPFKQYFIWHQDRSLSIMAITFVLIFGILNGLLMSIVASIILMLKNYSKPRVAWLGQLKNSHDFVDLARFPKATLPEGLLIARPDQPLFFANAEKIFRLIAFHVHQNPNCRYLVIDLEESPSMDSSSIEELLILTDALKQKNITLYLARVRHLVRKTLNYVDHPLLPKPTYHAVSVDDAVQAILKQQQKNTTV